MNDSKTGLIFEQTFEDLGTCAQAVDWDLDFRQLAPGKLDARVSVINAEDLQVLRFSFNTPFHQLGTPPPGFLTFGFPDPDSPSFLHYGQETHGGSMLNFNLTSGLDSVTADRFVGFAVVVRPKHLAHVCGQLQLGDSAQAVRHGSTQWRSTNTLKISQSIRGLFQRADRNDPCLPGLTRGIEEELAGAIAFELTSGPPDSEDAPAPYKARILRRTLEILNDADQLPISVSDLCAQVGVSSSSLNRIFLAEYSISPKAYIRARCLSAVRDELSCAPPNSKIVDVANRWGFWHMGQFARDFRKLFGQLPSQYLAS